MDKWGDSSEGPRRSRPGPIYDRAMRQIAEADLGVFCRWLGVPPTGPPEVLSGSFPAQTLYADLVVRVRPGQLLHAEYARDAEPDLAIRMAAYRVRLMEKHPGSSIRQIAIVLGDGRVASCDDPRSGFALGLQALYLRECAPETLLSDPHLAPLAVLASQASGRELATALSVIRTGTTPGPQQDALLEATAVLATIRLDGPTIDRVRRETGMTVESIADFYSETEVGQELMSRGNQQGIEQGIEQGVLETLTRLLRARFGDQAGLEAVAARLARWQDQDAAVTAVTRAAELGSIPADQPS